MTEESSTVLASGGMRSGPGVEIRVNIMEAGIEPGTITPYMPFAMCMLGRELQPLVTSLDALELPLVGASVTIPFKEEAAILSGTVEDGEAAGAQVLAISPQSVTSHERFSCAQGGFAFPLLADEDKGVGRAYGIIGPVPPDALTPNDPLYSNQWHLTKIMGPDAWSNTTGDSAAANTSIAQLTGSKRFMIRVLLVRLWEPVAPERPVLSRGVAADRAEGQSLEQRDFVQRREGRDAK